MISISVAGVQIENWTEYEIESSILQVGSFSLKRPFDAAAFRLCTPDAAVTIQIDGIAVITGFIDDRSKVTDRGMNEMEIAGRSRLGRMVQESAPYIGYDGLDLFEIAKRLADPWFLKITPSNARNRTVMRGRGRKVSSGAEPLVVKVRKKTWQVEPGQARMKILEQLASEAGYLVWDAGDGNELVIGKPNRTQDVQWLVANAAPGSNLASTATKLTIKESTADRFSLIMAVGSAAGDSINYGASTISKRGVVRNGPGIDGTGVDFDHPKRLILSERTIADISEADEIARREMARRDFGKLTASATLRYHGQVTSGTTPTIFTYDTLARVIDEELDPPLDDVFFVHTVKYRAGRTDGESTELVMVPRNTEIVK